MNSLYAHIKSGLKNAVERESALQIATRVDSDASTILRWINGASGGKSIVPFCNVLETVGARVVFPEDSDADFSIDIADKNKQIEKLKAALEEAKDKNIRLAAQIDAYVNMMRILSNGASKKEDEVNKDDI